MSYYADTSSPHEHAGLDAYVVDTQKENLVNWISKKGYTPKSLEQIRQYKRVCIVLGIQVEEEHRGQGIGRSLLDDLIGDAQHLHQAEVVILEADTSESNEFDLVAWYEDREFTIIEGERTDHPLMALVF